MNWFSTLFFIDANGYHTSDYPTVLAALQAQYQSIYGADVYLGADSQDGQFVAILAQGFFDAGMLGASVYNSFSPVTAQGVGLSRNVKINGLSRHIPTNSTVDLVIVGVAGTSIVNGIATDDLKNQWALPASILIPPGGMITVTATNKVAGAIAAVPNSVNKIFTPTFGWQTVNNPSAASLGEPVESDAQLRVRQQISTALPAQTVFVATIAAVENVSGVNKVRGYENYTNSTDVDGLPPHSISLVVNGGDAMEIAQTILDKKTPGTDTYGTTSEDVFDSEGMPYTINFFRPTVATVSVRITLHPLEGWSVDFETQIAAAVAAYINENPIGLDLQYTRLFLPAYLQGTPAEATFDIEEIETKKNAGAFAQANVPLDFDEEAFCNPAINVSFIIV